MNLEQVAEVLIVLFDVYLMTEFRPDNDPAFYLHKLFDNLRVWPGQDWETLVVSDESRRADLDCVDFLGGELAEELGSRHVGADAEDHVSL